MCRLRTRRRQSSQGVSMAVVHRTALARGLLGPLDPLLLLFLSPFLPALPISSHPCLKLGICSPQMERLLHNSSLYTTQAAKCDTPFHNVRDITFLVWHACIFFSDCIVRDLSDVPESQVFTSIALLDLVAASVTPSVGTQINWLGITSRFSVPQLERCRSIRGRMERKEFRAVS